ncbi:hypothetical protein K7G98_42055, partial [Saccharothrix sp. MB29]|nr:hypothetical protein [Saccharothrix sp. MB29]
SRPAAAPLTLAAPRGRRVRAERSPLGGEGDESEPARAGAGAPPPPARAGVGGGGRVPGAPPRAPGWGHQRARGARGPPGARA